MTQDVTFSKRITVSGNVNLILCDGAELIAGKGVNVAKGKSLTVWAQSTGDGAGKLTVITGGDRAAGIGGGNHGDVKKVTVNGGSVKAAGGLWGAGIGGGNCGKGEVEITGGRVDASGGEEGAGIGGGDEQDGGVVTVNGGEVKATGGKSGAGIGGGGPKDKDGRNGGSITISGGKVEARGPGSRPAIITSQRRPPADTADRPSPSPPPPRPRPMR